MRHEVLQLRSPALGRVPRAAGAHRHRRYRLPAVHLAGGADSRPARQGRRLDHRGRRKAGRQQADRPARSPTPTATRCRSTSRAGRRRPATATTRWRPARATWGRRASSTHPPIRRCPKDDNGYKASLLTLVCSRSAAVGELEGVDGSRPFCTGDGVGAVLSVIGPRDARGNVVHPTKVVSVNEPCETTHDPVPEHLRGCAGRVRQVRRGLLDRPDRADPRRAPADPAVPADAVTASGSGLDPHISIAYADLQVESGGQGPRRQPGPGPAGRGRPIRTDACSGSSAKPGSTCSSSTSSWTQKYPAKS